jgi:hypothetical protein
MYIQYELHYSWTLVSLNKLEVLDLSGTAPRSLERFCSIIEPGSGELSVRANFQDTQQGLQALQSLFDRSNVVRLFLRPSSSHLSDLVGYLTLLSSLRVLLLHLNIRPADQKAALDGLIHVLGRPDSAGPHLRTLYLLNCKPSLETVKKLVGLSGIQKLRILSPAREMNEELGQWSQRFAWDARQQPYVDMRAVIEDWYEEMW